MTTPWTSGLTLFLCLRPWAAVAAVAALAGVATGASAAPDPRDNQRPVYGSTWAGPFLDPVDERADRLMAMLEGQYVGRWPGAFAKRPDVDEVPAWAVWKRVNLPAFGSRVMWNEVREGGPEGRILRQRLVAISDDPQRSHNYADFYIFLNGERFGRADLDSSKLAGLTPASLPFFGRGCQPNIIGDGPGFTITADKASCVIVYPDGKARYNQFAFKVRQDGFEFFEAAYDLDGVMTGGAKAPVRFTRRP
jgi:hypothetical protein